MPHCSYGGKSEENALVKRKTGKSGVWGERGGKSIKNTPCLNDCIKPKHPKAWEITMTWGKLKANVNR